MMTRPTILEPLSTGDIIDRSVRLYRQNLRPLLGTVAVPFVVGALGWVVIEFGKNSFALDDPDTTAPVRAFVLMGIGFVFMLVYAYMMVLAVAGLSRTVGDHIMLGQPITVRASLRAIQSRLGTLTLASLFLVGALIMIGVLTTVVLFVALMIVGVIGALVTTLGLPTQVAGVLFIIVIVAALGVVVFGVVPLLVSRIVFIPQAIMIEGCSASTAFSRSLSLGAKNWNRVLSILLFSYFASLSLAAAVLTPITLALWLTGYLSFDRETFDAVTGGINQFSSFLVVPVWSIAYTLLYFDNRVRKEGYDVDLLARRLPLPPPPRLMPRPVAVAAAVPSFDVAPTFARAKFAPDGRCLRCGRYNLFASPSCPGCGW